MIELNQPASQYNRCPRSGIRFFRSVRGVMAIATYHLLLLCSASRE
jgi:hypothetical protein